MNTVEDSTASAMAPDFEKAFSDLEGPLATLVVRARAVSWFSSVMEEGRKDDSGNHIVSPGMMEAVGLMARDLEKEAEAIENQWGETHDKACELSLAKWRTERAGRQEGAR